MDEEPKTVTLQLTSKSPLLRAGTCVLDGKDISRFTSGISIEGDVDGRVRVKLDLLVRDGLDITVPTSIVGISAHVPLGYELIVEQLAEGMTRFHGAPRSEP